MATADSESRTPASNRPTLFAVAHMGQNIDTIAAVHARGEETIGIQQRLIERVTTRVGRPSTIYAIVLSAAGWMALNLLLPSWGQAPLDPAPFFWFQGFVTLAALVVATMVLTTQNRLAKKSEGWAHLDLQVNLVAEQKIAKLIALVEELRRDMPTVPNREDLMAAAMSKAVDPHAVVSALEDSLERGEPSSVSKDSLDAE